MSYQLNVSDLKKRKFSSFVQQTYSTEFPIDHKSFFISKKRINNSMSLKKSMKPVLLLEKSKMDNDLLRKLNTSLESKFSVEQRLKVLNEYWKKAILNLEYTRTLTEIKDQLIKMIRVPEISLEDDHIQQLQSKLKTEIEYSKSLEQKLRVMSIKNVEVHSNFDQINKEMGKWMELSSAISRNKTPVMKFKDIVNECIKKDELINQLRLKIDELKSNEDYLLDFVKKLREFKKERRLERAGRHVLPDSKKASRGHEHSNSQSLSSREGSSIEPTFEFYEHFDNT